MAKLALFLTITCLLSPFTSAQFQAAFTSVLVGWGNRAFTMIPANITEADGTQYWDIERLSLVDEPEGEFTLDLLNTDGSRAVLGKDDGGNLIVTNAEGGVTNVASQIPSIVGINGNQLYNVVQNNTQVAVNYIYDNTWVTRATNAEVIQDGNRAVDQMVAYSTLPAFFITPFKGQAYKQISDNLNGAQAVSAAVWAAQNPNATENGNGEDLGPTGPTITGNNLHVAYNLSSYDIDLLDDVAEIVATHGDTIVDVQLNNRVDGNETDVSYSTNVYTIKNLADNAEWQFTWIDWEGEAHDVINHNGEIWAQNSEGGWDDYTESAGYWAGAESLPVDIAVGNAIGEFVDAIANNPFQNPLVINVGEDGLDWTIGNQ